MVSHARSFVLTRSTAHWPFVRPTPTPKSRPLSKVRSHSFKTLAISYRFLLATATHPPPSRSFCCQQDPAFSGRRQIVFHSTRKRRGGEEDSCGRLRTVVAHGSKKAEEGLKRIDAALDALLPYGFSKETICSTINKLLKVYDDNAAWYLIEEGSYSLVIETILEEQKQEASAVILWTTGIVVHLSFVSGLALRRAS
ncbi:Ubiquitin-binding WIYLD domain [Musa troglodytarum]|uniref:Ubiquitin-binding WIYLD domain n=1 Tax=Musa troglodytarum TaxID=320322 RepID=A0A9E7HB37_9LILI|nr:Ubiquitin-binding WIYLD domain [Musa troglodytarum]